MYLLSNFAKAFENCQTIPVAIMLEPFLKQFKVGEGKTFKYNVFDFVFFDKVLDHPKVDILTAILLLDTVSNVYLNDPVF